MLSQEHYPAKHDLSFGFLDTLEKVDRAAGRLLSQGLSLWLPKATHFWNRAPLHHG